MIDHLENNSQPLPVTERACRLLRYIMHSNQLIHQRLHIWVHEPLLGRALGWSESVDEGGLEFLLDHLMKMGFIEKDPQY